MKDFTNRVLVVLVTMVAAFCVFDAEAQKVVTTINTSNKQACGEYLLANPQDTIRNVFEDKIVSVYLKDDETYLLQEDVVKFTRKVKENEALKAAADTSAVFLAAEFLLKDDTSPNGFYDIYYIKVGEKMMPIKYAPKYGLYAFGGAGYSFNEYVNSLVVVFGVGYERRWWKVDLGGQFAKSVLSSAAENPRKDYWVYGTQATVGVRPFQLDRDDINRLFVYGGLGFEFYKTDSKPFEDGSLFRSWGNYLYGVFGVGYERRFFVKAQSIEVCFEYHTFGTVCQNYGFERIPTFAAKVIYRFYL